MNTNISIADYQKIFVEAKQLVLGSQERFLQYANRTSIELYWQLGKLLAEVAERYQWGQQILARLSRDLTQSFSNSRGYSEQNLRYMRQFYAEYANNPALLDIAKNVRWGTNLIIMNRVKDLNARRFYLTLASETMCSRSVIELQIKSQAYERTYLDNKKHNFRTTMPPQLAAKAENIMKASYFLEVSKPFIGSRSLLEKQIENEMVSRIKEVIMMLGKGFAFIGNQYRITSGENEYFIDLLFFNRIIHSLVAVELKAKRFQAEYAGKMNLYLGLLDDYVKQSAENPSVGLILCTDRNSVEVDYALRDLNKPMGVAELEISKTLPREFVGKLPDPADLKHEIENELVDIDDIKDKEVQKI